MNYAALLLMQSGLARWAEIPCSLLEARLRRVRLPITLQLEETPPPMALPWTLNHFSLQQGQRAYTRGSSWVWAKPSVLFSILEKVVMCIYSGHDVD